MSIGPAEFKRDPLCCPKKAKKVCNWPQEAGCTKAAAAAGYSNDIMQSPSLCSNLADGLYKDPVDCSR